MIISIHQPDYIPYPGYFYKIFKSEVFVFLDDAQFSNKNIHNWNRIKTPQGECRLKIPVAYNFGDAIYNVRTRDELGWKEKHLKTLEMNYKKSQCYKEIFSPFKDILFNEYSNLADLNIAIISFICQGFGFETKFIKSTELSIEGKKEEKIIKICAALNGTTYLSGMGAKIYQKEENFTRNRLNLAYSDYKSIYYNQLWGNFIPDLSVLDYLFNNGFQNPFKKIV